MHKYSNNSVNFTEKSICLNDSTNIDLAWKRPWC